jgi:hypothetical protein
MKCHGSTKKKSGLALRASSSETIGIREPTVTFPLMPGVHFRLFIVTLFPQYQGFYNVVGPWSNLLLGYKLKFNWTEFLLQKAILCCLFFKEVLFERE